MTLLRQLPFIVFVLALISVVAQGVAQENPLLLIIAGTIAVVSWYITEWKGGHTLPVWVARALLIPVVAYALIESLQGSADLRPILGRFLLFLLLIKLYEEKTSQNYGLILLLSFVLMIVGCLLVAGPLFAVLLISYAVLSTLGLMLYQLFDARDIATHDRERPVPAGVIMPPLRPVYSRGLLRQFFVLTLMLGVLGFIISCFVFLFYPRVIQSGMLSGVMTSTRRVTSFNDNIDLFGNLSVTPSASRVFRLQLRDEHDQPIRMSLPLRLRASVFEVYEDGLWFSRQADQSDLIAVDSSKFEYFAPIVAPEEYVRQKFILSLRMQALPSLYAPFALRADDEIEVNYKPEVQTIALSPPRQRVVEYEVLSKLQPSDLLLTELTDDVDPLPMVELSTPDPRVQAMAYSLMDAAGIPRQSPSSLDERWNWSRQAANVFLRELSSGRYRYLLDIGSQFSLNEISRLGDPISWFLLDAKQGHCQYFATALAVLCQSVGVEARLVTGFLSVLYDDDANEYVVLAQNAHAWTEVRTGLRAWTPMDATPPGALSEFYIRDLSIANSLRWLYEDLENTWNTSVLEFDSNAREQISRNLGLDIWGFITGAWEQIAKWGQYFNRSFHYGVGGYVWLGIVTVSVLLLLCVFIQVRVRFSRADQAMHLANYGYQRRRELRREAHFYVDMLGLLAKNGIRKPAWKSPLFFAQEIAVDREQVGGLIRILTLRYYDIRFGSGQLSLAEKEDSKAKFEELRSLLEQAK